MRARTTWNTTEILNRTAATTRTADPYAMNQDHIKQQPPADKYLTGDPSAFAEDITTPNNWEVEYQGGAVKRDEIGLPEDRPDTFNHPEKTASNHEATLKKADIAVRIARRMLGANAPEGAIEEQAASLMHLPDQDVINTYNRLAGEVPPQFKEHQKEQTKEEAQGEAQEQAKQAALRGDKASFDAAIAKLVKLANDPQQQQAPMQQQGQAQQQAQGQPQQQQAPAQQQQQSGEQQSAWYDSKGQRPGHSGPDTGPYAGQQQAQGQPQQQQVPVQQQQAQGQPQQQMPAPQQQQQAQGQPQQMPPSQGVEGEVQQMIEQAAQQLQQAPKMANDPQQQQAPAQQQAAQQQTQAAPVQQAPVQQQQSACGPMQQQGQGLVSPNQGVSPSYAAQQQVQASDDQLLDQMLMPGGGQSATSVGAPIAEMDIQMEAPSMDIGDVAFQPGEDDMLKQLFASGDEAQAAQQAQDQQQGQGQVQSNIRTAAMRTVGTRPTAGVARIGGSGAAPSRGQEVDKLTSLWTSAPDVREAFGLK
jgi:hypothetical protein